ncbi:MAG TPA: hypothetical protein VFN22_03855 [Gemmatimonadales bacterium]|nr:hypothetical protein [Gemmatimonadales bacterium]
MLPEDARMLREQFRATLGIYLTYMAVISREVSVGAGHAIASETVRSRASEALRIVWYSHIYTLFEFGRANLLGLTEETYSAMPNMARMVLGRYLFPEWWRVGQSFRDLRHEVGFHRMRDDYAAFESSERFYSDVDPNSGPYLMRVVRLFLTLLLEPYGADNLPRVAPHWLPCDGLFPSRPGSIDKEYYDQKVAPAEELFNEGLSRMDS